MYVGIDRAKNLRKLGIGLLFGRHRACEPLSVLSLIGCPTRFVSYAKITLGLLFLVANECSSLPEMVPLVLLFVFSWSRGQQVRCKEACFPFSFYTEKT